MPIKGRGAPGTWGIAPHEAARSHRLPALGGGDRHVTADELYAETTAAGCKMSLATVYNALHQFKKAGLVREIAIGGACSYFDTNTSNHSHFYNSETGCLSDIDVEIHVEGLPEVPNGTKTTYVDVIVHLTPV